LSQQATARDRGVFSGSYACVGGTSAVLPVALHIPGGPPPPVALVAGLLALLEHVEAEPSTGVGGENVPRRRPAP